MCAFGRHREGEGILVASRARLRGLVWLDVFASKLRSEFEAGSEIFGISDTGVEAKKPVCLFLRCPSGRIMDFGGKVLNGCEAPTISFRRA